MTFALKLVMLAVGGRSSNDGRLLKSFDPDAAGGRGRIETTDDIEEAKTFPSAYEAFKYWKTQSTVRPLRPDGKPNRPLTAYTVEVVTKSR